jgi:hypothetical protein
MRRFVPIAAAAAALLLVSGAIMAAPLNGRPPEPLKGKD